MDPVTNMASDTATPRETLDAFVDGALAPEEAARVVLRLADCPRDQAYVDALMETNALLASAYAGPLHQPLPERLRATIFAPAAGGTARRSAARPSGWRIAAAPRHAVWGALAASCAAAGAVFLTLAPRHEAGGVGPDPSLVAALETGPSGAMAEVGDGAELMLIATFVDRDGRPCREYEILDLAGGALTEGLACRAPTGGWTTEVSVASRIAVPAAAGEGYVPASGADAGDEALDATLDRLGVGMSLPAAEEAALISAGWTR